ncbi:PREDICTED: beta-defensin 128 [Miniopterus natalensis]|uniref:beta-defensin 128 n=1 Tax=Miniopterus natalensis TaxID=291302 RepID=UPI0007A6B6AE|nr:PREDICTED: beta-defensin 128 [Miniopterus natalensis]
MKLFLVLIILLFEVPTDATQLQKCYGNVAGYCRKKCRVGEIQEMLCLNKKLCCINEEENKNYQKKEELLQLSLKNNQKWDYSILPTVTFVTIQL